MHHSCLNFSTLPSWVQSVKLSVKNFLLSLIFKFTASQRNLTLYLCLYTLLLPILFHSHGFCHEKHVMSYPQPR
jgi:hypothetical protein